MAAVQLAVAGLDWLFVFLQRLAAIRTSYWSVLCHIFGDRNVTVGCVDRHFVFDIVIVGLHLGRRVLGVVVLAVGGDTVFVFRIVGLTVRVAVVVLAFRIAKEVGAVRKLTKLRVAVVVGFVVLVVFVFSGIRLYPKETEIEAERYN